MHISSRFALALLLTLLLALPLASHALNMCTDANGRPTYQDKPCETRDAAPQFKSEAPNRVVQSQGDEFLRVGLEDGAVKLGEMSELKATGAMRKR